MGPEAKRRSKGISGTIFPQISTLTSSSLAEHPHACTKNQRKHYSRKSKFNKRRTEEERDAAKPLDYNNLVEGMSGVFKSLLIWARNTRRLFHLYGWRANRPIANVGTGQIRQSNVETHVDEAQGKGVTVNSVDQYDSYCMNGLDQRFCDARTGVQSTIAQVNTRSATKNRHKRRPAHSMPISRLQKCIHQSARLPYSSGLS